MAFRDSVSTWLSLLRERLIEEHECILTGLAQENRSLRRALSKQGVQPPAEPAPEFAADVPQDALVDAPREWTALSRALKLIDGVCDKDSSPCGLTSPLPEPEVRSSRLMDAFMAALPSGHESHFTVAEDKSSDNNNNNSVDDADFSTHSFFGKGPYKGDRTREVEWLFPDVAKKISVHRDAELSRDFGSNSQIGRALSAVCPQCGNVYMGDSEYCRMCGIRRPTEAEAGRPTTKELWDIRPAWSRTPSQRGLGSYSAEAGNQVMVPKRSLRRNNTVQALSRSSVFERFMLDPSSKRRFTWDCIASLLIVYDTITLPMNWGFGWQFHTATVNDAIMWCLMIFFTLDIPLTCMTGFHDQGRLIMSPSQVVYHYFKGYMILDLLAVCPEWLGLILENQMDESGYFRISKSIRMLRILRTLKLIRLARLNRFAHDIIASISSEYWASFLKIAKLSLILLLISHYAACGWFAVGWQNDGWVDDDLRDSSFWKQYLVSMEWSLNNYGGGGDGPDPTTVLELLYSCIIAFTSILCESYLISSLTNAMSQVARFHGQTMQRRWMIYQYLSDHKISKPLQVRVRKFLAEQGSASAPNSRNADLAEVFQAMPPYLLMEINTEVIMPLLRRNTFLTSTASNWPHVIPKLCTDAMGQKHLVEEETLFTVDQECLNMSFLLTGTLRYEYNVDMVEDAMYQRWYSEVAMYLAFVHRGTMCCCGDADFVLLYMHPFEKLIMQHPALHREMAESATNFRTWVRNRPESHGPLTDLTRAAGRTSTGTLEDMLLAVNPTLRLIRATASVGMGRRVSVQAEQSPGQYEI